MSEPWIPDALEQKCLEHLDAPGGWRMLHYEPPEPDQVLPWTPFRRIFLYNVALFAAVLTGVYVVIELGLGGGIAGVREDLGFGALFVGVLATLLALYSMHLYRRSWNRRARSWSR